MIALFIYTLKVPNLSLHCRAIIVVAYYYHHFIDLLCKICLVTLEYKSAIVNVMQPINERYPE